MALNLEQLLQSLARCRISNAIDLLKPFVEAALPGEIELLIDAAPKALRPRLALLLNDLLSGWPGGVVGVPVLLWCVNSEDKAPELRRVVLPGAETQCSEPCDGLRFLGWLHADALLPAVPIKAGTRLADVEVGVGDAAVAVALFNIAGVDVEELTGLEAIRPVWWGELLDSVAGSVYMSAGVVQAYPVALEVARAMARAIGGKLAAPCVFSTRGEIEVGVAAGKAFPGRAAAALGVYGSRPGGDDELI